MCDFKIKYRHPNPLQWHHWATAADKQWFRPVAASCPAVRVQSFRRTDRGINCVARVHFKSDTWEPCNLVRSNKQKHTFWRLPTKCQVDARQVHCLVYVQTTGDRKIITAHHYIAHHSFKANKEINSEAIKIDKCSGALSPTGSKVCYGNGFLCNLVLSADLLQSMWCVLRWKKAGDSLLFSICRDAGVHHGEAWLVWWKGHWRQWESPHVPQVGLMDTTCLSPYTRRSLTSPSVSWALWLPVMFAGRQCSKAITPNKHKLGKASWVKTQRSLVFHHYQLTCD